MNLPLSVIAPSHGVIWKNDPTQIVEKYLQWADAYQENQITINYGYTYAIGGILELMKGLKFKKKKAAAFGSYRCGSSGWRGSSCRGERGMLCFSD